MKHGFRTGNNIGIAGWGSGGQDFVLRLSGGALQLFAGGTSTATGLTGGLNDGQFHHVAVVYDPALGTDLVDLQMYVDGQPELYAVVSNKAINTNAGNILLGSTTSAGTPALDGLLDEVRVWDVALDSVSIRNNYLSPISGNEPGLRGLWNFEDTTGGTPKNVVDATVGGFGPATGFAIDSGFYRSSITNATPSYAWFVNGSQVKSGLENYLEYDTTAEIYVVVSNNGCATFSDTINLREVLIDTSLVLNPDQGTYPFTILCVDDSVVLTANEVGPPAVSYQWFYGRDTIVGETNQSITANLTGPYTVAITKEGCIEPSTTGFVRISPDYDATLDYETDTICEDGSVLMSLNSVNTNAYIRTGVGQYARSTGILNTVPAKGFSMEMWFKPDLGGGAANANTALAQKVNVAAGAFRDYFRIAFNGTGQLVFETDSGGTNFHQLVNPFNSWVAEEWYHVAVTWDSRRGKALFVNGIARYDSSRTAVMGDFAGGCGNGLLVGAGYQAGSCGTINTNFDGQIDEVRVWEISHPRAFFVNNSAVPLTGLEQGLLALWQMDSTQINSSFDLEDASGNGNNLIMTGAGVHNFSTEGFYRPIQYPNYQWFRDGVLLAGDTNMTLLDTMGGDYYAVVQNGIGPNVCSFSSDTAMIRVNILNDSLFFDVVHDTVFCDDTDSAKVWVEANLGMIVDWYDSVGNTLLVAGQDTAYFDTTGTYFAVLRKQYTEFDGDTVVCFDTTRYFHVIELENPLAFAGYDTLFCYGDTLLLGGIAPDSVTGSGGNIIVDYTYGWRLTTGADDDMLLDDTTVANPFFVGDTVNTFNFVVTVTDDSGCFHIDTVQVDVNPQIFAYAGMDTILCFEDSLRLGGLAPDSITASGGSGGNFTAHWTPQTYFADPADSTSFNPLVVHNTNLSGDRVNYILTLVDTVGGIGCEVRDTVRVRFNSRITVDSLVTDTVVCFNDSTLLGTMPPQSGGIAPFNYLWKVRPYTSGILVPDSTIANPQFYGAASGTYSLTLEVTDSIGCFGDTTITMIVNDTIMVDAGVDTVVCYGDTLTLGGAPTAMGGSGGVFTYAWNDPLGVLDDTTLANPTLIHNVTLPTNAYQFILEVYDTTSAQICEVYDTVEITMNAPLNVNILTVPNDTTCFGVPVQLFATPGGGSPPFTYEWNPSTFLDDPTAQNPIFSADSSGLHTFTLTLKDTMDPFIASCTIDSTVSVYVRDTILITAEIQDLLGNPDSIACWEDSLLLVALVASGEGPFTYSWSSLPPGNANIISAGNQVIDTIHTASTISAGYHVYNLTVSDPFGCFETDQAGAITNDTIYADSDPVMGEDTVVVCFGNNQLLGGFIPGAGGSAPLTYSWTPTQKLDDPTLAKPTLSGDSAQQTWYTLTVTDTLGCFNNDSVFVYVNDSISLELVPDDTVCYGESMFIGEILFNGDTTVTGGTKPYTYTWNSPTGSMVYLDTATDINNPEFNFNGDAPSGPFNVHVYNLIITDSVLCQNFATISIYVNDSLRVRDGIADSLCFNQDSVFGGGILPTADGGVNFGFTYQWEPAAFFDDPTSDKPTFTSSFVGDTLIRLVTTDGIGCTDTVEKTLRSHPLPTVTFSTAQSFDMCRLEDTTIVAIGGNPVGYGTLLYSWNNGVMNDTIVVSPPSDSVYYVTVTNSVNGCEVSDSVQVLINEIPDFSFSETGVSALPTDTLAACVTDPTNPTLSLYWVLNNTGSLNPPILGNWSTLSGGAIIFGNNSPAGPSSLTTYFPIVDSIESRVELAVEDLNGCTTTDTLYVFLNKYAEVRMKLSDSSICFGDSVYGTLQNLPAQNFSHIIRRIVPTPAGVSQIIALGPDSTFGWVPGAELTNPISNITTPTWFVYEWAYTDASGCRSVLYDSVLVNPRPTITTSATPDTICFGESDTLLAFLQPINHHTGALSFNWNPGGTTPDGTLIVSPTVNTTYTVFAIDSAGCFTDTASIDIEVLPLPDATLNSNAPISICSDSTVALTVPLVPGQYYSWIKTNTGVPDTVLQGIDEDSLIIGFGGIIDTGDFHVAVIGLNGCESLSDTVVIDVDTVPTFTVTTPDPTKFCDGGNAFLTVNTNPQAAYGNYVWHLVRNGMDSIYDASNSRSIFAFDSGTYYATYESTTLGCRGSSDSLQIFVDTLPLAQIDTFAPIDICDGGVFTFNAEFPGAGTYTYQWFLNGAPIPTATLPSFPATNQGTYQVEVTNQVTGCSDTSAGVFLTVNPLPLADVDTTAGTARFCDPGSVTFDVTTLIASSNYTWVYDTLSTDTVQGPNLGGPTAFTTDSAGFYYLLIQDVNGCISSSDTIEVIVDTIQQYPITGADTVCRNSDSIYTAPVTGNWFLTPASAGSFLTGTVGVNSVTIRWNQVGTAQLRFSPTQASVLCPVDTTINIEVVPKPNTSIVGLDTVCANTTENYVAGTIGGNFSHVWTMTAGSFNSTSGPTNLDNVNVNFAASIPGGFTTDTLQMVQTNTTTGCDTLVTLMITSFDTVNATFLGDTNVCENATVTYTISNTTPNATYTSYVSPNGTITGSGPQSVTVTWGAGPTGFVAFAAENGPCVDSVFRNVTITAAPIANIEFQNGDDSICATDYDTLLVWTDNPNPNDSVTWNLALSTPGIAFIDPNFLFDADTTRIIINNNNTTTDGFGIIRMVQTNKASECEVEVFDTLTIFANPDTLEIANLPEATCADGVQRQYNWSIAGQPVFTSINWGISRPSNNNINFLGNQIFVTWNVADVDAFITAEISNGECFRIDTFHVQVDTIAQAQVFPNADSTFCSNEPTTLVASPWGPGYQYQWFLNGDSIIGATDSVYVVDSLSGGYSFSVATPGGCEDLSDTVNMNVLGIPNATIVGDTILCPGDTVIWVSADNNVSSYQWWNVLDTLNPSLVSTLPTFEVSQAGRWQLILGDGVCTDTSARTFSFILADPVAAIAMEDTFCNNDTVDLIALVAGDSLTYLWTTNGLGTIVSPGDSITKYIPSPLDQGLVSFDLTVSNPCNVAFDETEVLFLDAPSAFFKPSYPVGEINQEIVFILEDKTATDYIWDFGDGSGDTGVDPSHIYSTDGEYMVGVLAQNANGCTDTFGIPFTVTNNEQVFVPNAFSPNSSNQENTTFKIYGYNIQSSEFEMVIFNRWGTKVWSTTDLSEARFSGWNGTSDGIGGGEVPQGVYTYYIRGKFRSGDSFEKAGTVNLIR